jgi:two-component system, OmpR family, response regulator
MRDEKIKVFLVDDDILYLKSLKLELNLYANFAVETYATGELCIEHLLNKPSVIILDYHLDGIDKNAMNGLETLDKVKKTDPAIHIIMLSSQDKIEVAVNCMHHGAFDYVVKSETAFIRLHKIIESISKYEEMEKTLSWYMERV